MTQPTSHQLSQFSLCSHNIRGTRGSLPPWVLDWIASSPFDIIALQETRSYAISVTGYRTFASCPPPPNQIGYPGVALLVRHRFRPTQIGTSSSNIVACRLRFPHVNVIVIGVYLPGTGSSANSRRVTIAALENLLKNLWNNGGSDSPIVVLGDFNCPRAAASSILRDYGVSSVPHPLGSHTFSRRQTTNRTEQLSRIIRSTLDYIFISKHLSTSGTASVGPATKSDHLPISARVSVHTKKRPHAQHFQRRHHTTHTKSDTQVRRPLRYQISDTASFVKSNAWSVRPPPSSFEASAMGDSISSFMSSTTENPLPMRRPSVAPASHQDTLVTQPCNNFPFYPSDLQLSFGSTSASSSSSSIVELPLVDASSSVTQHQQPVTDTMPTWTDRLQQALLFQKHIQHLNRKTVMKEHDRQTRIKRELQKLQRTASSLQSLITSSSALTARDPHRTNTLKDAHAEVQKYIKDLRAHQESTVFPVPPVTPVTDTIAAFLSTSCSKTMWQTIRARLDEPSTFSPSSVIFTSAADDKLPLYGADLIAALKTHLSAVYSDTRPVSSLSDPSAAPVMHHSLQATDIEALQQPLSATEFVHLIRCSARTTSADTNGVSFDILRSATKVWTSSPDFGSDTSVDDNMATYLFSVVRDSLTQPSVPPDWGICRLCILPKKPGKCPITHVRPIAILDVRLKLLMSAIAQRLDRAVENSNIIYPWQFGFRRGSGCDMAVAFLQQTIENRRARGRPTYAAFIDFTKAYDRVPHDLLLSKLHAYGLPDQLLALLSNTMASTVYSLDYKHHHATIGPFKCGLRQGCPLSPLLFNIFSTDLWESLPQAVTDDLTSASIKGIAYADDTTLLAESPEALQQQVNALQQWCSKNNMLINVHKSVVMAFHKSTTKDLSSASQDDLIVVIGDDRIPQKQSFKYLGVMLDTHNSVEAAIAKATRTCIGVSSSATSLLADPHIPMKLKKLVLTSKISTSTTCGLGALPVGNNCTSLRKIDRPFYTACRVATDSIQAPTSGPTLLAELRIRQPSVMVMNRHIMLLRSFSTSPCAAHQAWVTALLSSQASISKGSWLSSALRLLKSLDISIADLLAKDKHAEDVKKSVYLKLESKFNKVTSRSPKSHQWYSSSQFEDTSHVVEKARNSPDTCQGAACLSQMRTSSLRTFPQMAHESHRALPKDVARAVCPYCKDNVPETLTHMTMQCKAWQGIRHRFLQHTISKVRQVIPSVNDDQMTSFILGGIIPDIPKSLLVLWRQKVWRDAMRFAGNLIYLRNKLYPRACAYLKTVADLAGTGTITDASSISRRNVLHNPNASAISRRNELQRQSKDPHAWLKRPSAWVTKAPPIFSFHQHAQQISEPTLLSDYEDEYTDLPIESSLLSGSESSGTFTRTAVAISPTTVLQQQPQPQESLASLQPPMALIGMAVTESPTPQHQRQQPQERLAVLSPIAGRTRSLRKPEPNSFLSPVAGRTRSRRKLPIPKASRQQAR